MHSPCLRVKNIKALIQANIGGKRVFLQSASLENHIPVEKSRKPRFKYKLNKKKFFKMRSGNENRNGCINDHFNAGSKIISFPHGRKRYNLVIITVKRKHS